MTMAMGVGIEVVEVFGLFEESFGIRVGGGAMSWGVGSFVGIGFGATDGGGVGGRLGSDVGAAVGAWVGEAVGPGDVGPGVGGSEGRGDGAEVGAETYSRVNWTPMTMPPQETSTVSGV